MDVGPGPTEAGWGFAGVAVSAILTQIGIAIRASRAAAKKKILDDAGAKRDIEVLLENKDARAFKFLVDRLDAAEKAHKACEDRADEMMEKFAALGRKFDLAIYSMDVLKASMQQGGITLPPLPAIERS